MAGNKFLGNFQKYGAAIVTGYVKKLETHPIMTKCLTSAAISASADATCQYLENNKKFDTSRFVKL